MINFYKSKSCFIMRVYTSSFQTAYLIHFYHVLKKTPNKGLSLAENVGIVNSLTCAYLIISHDIFKRIKKMKISIPCLIQVIHPHLHDTSKSCVNEIIKWVWCTKRVKWKILQGNSSNTLPQKYAHSILLRQHILRVNSVSWVHVLIWIPEEV